jgi:hypothetical protein
MRFLGSTLVIDDINLLGDLKLCSLWYRFIILPNPLITTIHSEGPVLSVKELRVSDWLSEIDFFNMIEIDDESFA